jgi:hypothetical protein
MIVGLYQSVLHFETKVCGHRTLHVPRYRLEGAFPELTSFLLQGHSHLSSAPSYCM